MIISLQNLAKYRTLSILILFHSDMFLLFFFFLQIKPKQKKLQSFFWSKKEIYTSWSEPLFSNEMHIIIIHFGVCFFTRMCGVSCVKTPYIYAGFLIIINPIPIHQKSVEKKVRGKSIKIYRFDWKFNEKLKYSELEMIDFFLYWCYASATYSLSHVDELS